MPSCAVAMKRSCRRGSVEDAADDARDAVALLGAALDGGARDADDGELGGDEQRVQRQQRDDDEDRDELSHRWLRAGRRGRRHVVGHVAEERPQHVLERDDAEGAARRRR